jgi:hypothetical protein
MSVSKVLTLIILYYFRYYNLINSKNIEENVNNIAFV